jgi:hypothetical protein
MLPLLLPVSSALLPPPLVRQPHDRLGRRRALRMDAASTVASDGWKALMAELDQVPVFVCANAAGQPLQYEKEGRPLALFYTDLAQAQQELKERRQELPELDLRLLPIGLGSAFKRASVGNAIVVPSAAELANAADPEADEPYGAGVPLFGCLAMRKPHANREGVQAMPLFLCAADAESSRDAAAQMAAPGTQGLELLVIPLARALERMVEQPSDDGLIYEIVPPGASVDFVRQFLASPPPGRGAGGRVARAPEPGTGEGGIFPS